MSLFRTKNIEAMLAAARDDGLKKVLGPVDLILMGIGAIIGTGIFVLTGTGALTAGPALTVSFVIAALACGFAAPRKTRPDLPRAFRCPGVPVVPLLSAGFCLFLMAHLQALTWVAFLAWLAIGLAIYFLYARRNAVLHGGD